MRLNRFLKQFNWRFLLVRIVVNALALAFTAAILPKIYFVDKSIENWLLMAVMLGILNALLKPVLQFLTLQFLFVTYGLVVALVNTLILLLLSFLFPTRFAVDNLLWAFVGGLVLGIVSSFLESLLGLTMPVVPDEPAEPRQKVGEQARHVERLAVTAREAEPTEQAPDTETPPRKAITEGSSVAGLSSPEPDEGPSPPEAVEAEPSDPEDLQPEPNPEPREEQKEEGS